MCSPSWPDSLSDSSGHAIQCMKLTAFSSCQVLSRIWGKNIRWLINLFVLVQSRSCNTMTKHSLNWLRVVCPIKRQLLMKTIKQFWILYLSGCRLYTYVHAHLRLVIAFLNCNSQASYLPELDFSVRVRCKSKGQKRTLGSLCCVKIFITLLHNPTMAFDKWYAEKHSNFLHTTTSH